MSDPAPPDPARPRLVVLFGGQSAEHDVSRVTARHVLAALDHDRFEVVPVGITRAGEWVLAEAAARVLLAGPDVLAERLPDALTIDGPAVDPLPMLAPAQGAAEPSPGSGPPPVVVFPLLHGPMGEDGTVQGLLEIAGVPYVGSGVLGSAVAMDKVAAKQMALAAGVPQARWRGLHLSQVLADLAVAQPGEADVRPEVVADLADDLGFPMFVKPANMGSSIGVSRATDPASLRTGLLTALEHDEWLVVEEGVDGREIEVAVLGHTVTPRASVPGEIVPGADFYDYDDKYADGTAELRVPAPLPSEVADEVRALACRAFTAMRAEGMARVDFFYEPDGRGLLLNEVNTIPGFTPISMFPRLWQASGLTYRALLDELIALALERFDATRRRR
jgi:D-alanine-D-alanine ligase